MLGDTLVAFEDYAKVRSLDAVERCIIFRAGVYIIY